MRVIVIGITSIIIGMAMVTAAEYRLAENREIRVDHFDSKGNRTGYSIINEKTGKVETFDKNSRRVGSGQVTPTPQQQQEKENSSKKNR